MSGHADTIRRIRNQLPADVARDFDALLAENQRLREALERIADWGDDLAVPAYQTIARAALRSEQ